MATFHSMQDTFPQQNVSSFVSLRKQTSFRGATAWETKTSVFSGYSFVNNNSYQVTGTAVLAPASDQPQEQNNAKLSLFNAGRKRKFIPDFRQHNNIPNKQPALQTTQQFFCEICKVQLNSLSQATHHKGGKSHQLNAKKKEILCSMKDSTEQHTSSSELNSSPDPTILPKAITTWSPQGRVDLACVICFKKFNSKTQAEQHFNGQAHKRKLQALHHVGKIEEKDQTEPTAEEAAAGTLSQEQLMEALSVGTTASQTALSSENTETNELHCEFCRVTLNSQSQMDKHLMGAKHKNSVSRAASLPADGDAPMMFYCEDCSRNFNSQNQLVQHLTSPKHLNRVHPPAGQFRGTWRGRGRGQGRGGGAASLPADGNAPKMFHCEDCNTNFNSQNQLEQHLTSPKHLRRVHPPAGQFRGTMRGRGRGQGRGRGALRGGQSNRGRGAVSLGLSKPPPITSSFVKANSNTANMDNQGYPFSSPGQSMNHTPNFSGENPSF